MTPLDAALLSVLFTRTGRDERTPWRLVAVPVLAFLLAKLGLGMPGTALAVIAAVAVGWRWPPPAILLALPAYPTLGSVVVAVAGWTVGRVLLDGLGPRLESPAVPTWARGLPVRALSCGILYAGLHPVSLV